MARRFNGTSDFIVFTLPTTLETVTAGSTTIVVVANFTDATDGGMVHARTSGGTNSWWMESFTSWNYGQGGTAKNVGAITTGSWAAYIGRKTTGGANAPRGRKIVFGGATTDVTAGTGLADGTAPGVGGILQVGKWGTAAEFISADVAAVAVFNSDLSDATTATFTTWANILAATPVWAVHFDQAAPTDAITDATGNGGNSSSITGTTIVSNPSGFFAGGSVSGAADLSSGSNLTAAGTRVQPATVALASGSNLTVAATVVKLGTAALSSSPVLTVAAVPSKLGLAALTSAPTLTAAAQGTQAGAVALASSPVLVAAGTIPGPAITYRTAVLTPSAAAPAVLTAAALAPATLTTGAAAPATLVATSL